MKESDYEIKPDRYQVADLELGERIASIQGYTKCWWVTPVPSSLASPHGTFGSLDEAIEYVNEIGPLIVDAIRTAKRCSELDAEIKERGRSSRD